MTAVTDTFRTAEFLVSEGNGHRSREEVTVNAVSADGLVAGQVMGKIVVGTASAAAQGGNTGNATSSAVTVGSKAKPGVYIAEFTAATTFFVLDPDGINIGNGVTGTAFSVTDHIDFTLTAGGTPMVAGDGFNITVAAGSGQYVEYDAAGTTGAQTVAGVLYEGVPDGVAVDRTVIVRDAEVVLTHLTYTGTEATVVAGLKALGIVTR